MSRAKLKPLDQQVIVLAPLLKTIEDGEIDPSFVITHTRPLAQGPELYKTFRDKKDGCIKVALKP
jgi:threonine dehydrogenase-like Zn-dependent dehydrogenase